MRKQTPLTYESFERLLNKTLDVKLDLKFAEHDKKFDTKLVVQSKEYEGHIERYMGMLREQFQHDLAAHTEHIPTIMNDISMLTESAAILKDDVLTLKMNASLTGKSISILTTDVAIYKNQILAIRKDVSGIKEDVAGLKEDMEIVKDRLHLPV